MRTINKINAVHVRRQYGVALLLLNYADISVMNLFIHCEKFDGAYHH